MTVGSGSTSFLVGVPKMPVFGYDMISQDTCSMGFGAAAEYMMPGPPLMWDKPPERPAYNTYNHHRTLADELHRPPMAYNNTNEGKKQTDSYGNF